MSVQIVPVESRRDLRRFIDAPWRIYDSSRHPQWVPPLRIAVKDALNVKSNPFYRHAARRCFVAMRGDAVVGRIAAIENQAHNEFHEDRVGFFGFFESIDDREVASALFGAAESWLRGRGLETMRGPMNPSTNHECGLLVDGFDEHPVVMTTWNPPYYARLVEAAGFAKAKDLLAFHIPVLGPDAIRFPDRYQRHAEYALSSGSLVFRDMSRRHFAR